MIYHLNINIGNTITGIEKAAILRHNIVKKIAESKLVTIRYNTNLAECFLRYGVSSDEYLNMYDFFQETISISKESKTIYDIFNQNSYRFDCINKNDYRVYYNEVYIAYVHLREGEINYINYFDSHKQKRERHIYDSRGFLSNIKLLTTNQKVILETFFNSDGEKKIEKFYSLDGENELTQIKVYHKNEVFFLTTEQELITLFFKLSFHKSDTTISDKNGLVNPSLVQVDNIGKKIAVIHSKHYQGFDVNNRISITYREIFDHLDKFDHIVSSTQTQTNDLRTRYNSENKFSCIPVGVSEEEKMNHYDLSNKEQKFKIGVVARYYAEKRIDHAIRAFGLFIKNYPKAELHLYGFGDGRDGYKTERELRSLVKELELENNVFFRGFLLDLSEEWKTINLQLITSSYEGFCLAILEGMSRGVPSIAYDINYGPKDIIENGESGILVEDGNIDELSIQMQTILLGKQRFLNMVTKAYEKAQCFSEDEILTKWKEILNG